MKGLSLLSLCVAGLLCTACESDQAKYTRLAQDKASACLGAQYGTDSLRLHYQTECALAQRKLNQFIAGHR